MRKKKSNQLLIRRINLFAFSTAAFLAIGLPGIYFLDDYLAEVDEVEKLASSGASVLNRKIGDQPGIWPSQMQELMIQMRASDLDDDEDETAIFISDADGKVIASDSNEKHLNPAIIKESALYHGDIPLGTYTVERSYNDVLIETFIVACGGFLLALIVVVPLRKLPLGSLHEALNTVEEEKEKALITLQSIRDAVITTDASMRVEYISPTAAKLTGWSTESARGLPLEKIFRIIDPASRETISNSFVAGMSKDAHADVNHRALLIRNGDNQEFHIEDSSAPIRRADGEMIGVVIVFHDVTMREAHHTHLLDIAFHDALTKLPNRALFQNKLSAAMDDAGSKNKFSAVFFMDLDRFKIINDSFGHDVGDELLVLVSKRLRQCVRNSDTVSRIGGDEFAAVLHRLDSPEEAKPVAEKIIKKLSYPFCIRTNTLHISVSIGIAIYPGDGDSTDVLLKNADTAMYLAKNFGRNNFKYFHSAKNAADRENLNCIDAS